MRNYITTLLAFLLNSYNVFEIKKPYLTYKIANVTVQQLDYRERELMGM